MKEEYFIFYFYGSKLYIMDVYRDSWLEAEDTIIPINNLNENDCVIKDLIDNNLKKLKKYYIIESTYDKALKILEEMNNKYKYLNFFIIKFETYESIIKNINDIIALREVI